MRTSRIYTPGPLVEGERIALAPMGANHIARVLRARVGDVIGVFDGEGSEHLATIAAIKGNAVTVTIGAATAACTESPLKIALVQGISRGERMDWVIQKATELGVASLLPVVTARTVVKLDRDQAAKKHDHWRNIAIGACEQCGRNRLPLLVSATTLPQFLNTTRGEAVRIILDPTAAQSLMTLPSMTDVELLIGPEGGLDLEEITSAKRSGFIPVSLGPRVLRTETAAVAAIAMLQGKWGDLR